MNKEINYPGYAYIKRTPYSKPQLNTVFPFLDTKKVEEDYENCMKYKSDIFKYKKTVGLSYVSNTLSLSQRYIDELNIKYLFIPKEDACAITDINVCNLTNVETIFIPETMKSLELYMPINISLKQMYIPPNLKELQVCTFESSNLEQIIIDASTTKIPKHFCYGCKKLTSLKITNEKIKEIDEAAFAFTNLTHIEIPENIKHISRCAFITAHLEEITFKDIDNLTLEDYAFQNKLKKDIIVNIYANDKEYATTWFENNKKKLPSQSILVIKEKSLDDIIKSKTNTAKSIENTDIQR